MTRMDPLYHQKISTNHSARYLLHRALHHHLGSHIKQVGSTITSDRLHFDFNHHKALTQEEIIKIEDEVNQIIRENIKIENDDSHSVDLCKDSHVKRSGDIGMFIIKNDISLESNTRRIEALTGENALNYLSERRNLLDMTAHELKIPPEQVPHRIKKIFQESKELETEIEKLRHQIAMGEDTSSIKTEKINNVNFVSQILNDVDGKDLPKMIDEHKQRIGSGIILLLSKNKEKIALATGVTKDMTRQFSAIDLVKSAAHECGGKGGGGRVDFAMAGGKDAHHIEDSIQSVRNMISLSSDPEPDC